MSDGFIARAKNFLEGNSTYSTSDVTSSLANISDDLYHRGQSINSIFSLDENSQLDYNQFLELMSDASQMAISDLNQDEMEMLFSILNESGDDVLSYDELKILAKGNEITDFSMWSALACISEDELTASSDDDTDDDATTTGTTGTTGSNGTTGTNSSSSTNNSNSTNEPKLTEDGKYDFSDAYTALWYIGVERNDDEKTPKEVADRLLNEGVITEEEYDQIKANHLNLTSQQEEKVKARMTQRGISFEEAVKELGFDVTASTFETTFEEIKEAEEVAEAEAAAAEAEEAGILDETALAESVSALTRAAESRNYNEVLELMGNLSDAEFTQVLNEMIKNGTSLVQLLDTSDFTEAQRQELMQTMGNKLMAEAKNGSADAVNILCKELYNGTAGQWTTADEFVTFIINNSPIELLAVIIAQYPTTNTNRSLEDDIKGDYSGSIEKTLLERINSAKNLSVSS